MKKQIIAVALAILMVGASLFLIWRVSSELSQQRLQATLQEQRIEQQAILLSLLQHLPNAVPEGLIQVSKVYIVQANVPGSSSHLYAFLGGGWVDLGEGKLTTDNQTRGE